MHTQKNPPVSGSLNAGRREILQVVITGEGLTPPAGYSGSSYIRLQGLNGEGFLVLRLCVWPLLYIERNGESGRCLI